MIIGITGTLGAGKGTAAQYLAQKHGFNYFSVRDFLNEEIARRNLSSNRDTMTMVANDLRATHGPEYISQQLVGRAIQDGGNVVIESIRSIGEARYLKDQGGVIWAIDADIHTRYARITARLSETDHVSFEKFVSDEEREMENDDPSKQNIRGVIALADRIFQNDGSAEDLYAHVDAALEIA